MPQLMASLKQGFGAVLKPKKNDAPTVVNATSDDVGLPIPTYQAALNYLRVKKRLQAGEDIVYTAVQQTRSQYGAFIFLTSKRLIFVRSDSTAAPKVGSITHEEGREYFPGKDAGELVVRTSKKAYTIVGLLEVDIQKLIRVRSALKDFDAPEVAVAFPERLGFNNVYPMEYYEAVLGPDEERDIDVKTYGNIEIALVARTSSRQGWFILEQREVQKDGTRVRSDLDIPPFRNNKGTFNRQGNLPRTITIWPVDLSPQEALAKHHIEMTQGTEIKNRYRRVIKIPALDIAMHLLQKLEVPLNDENGALVEGREGSTLIIQGEVFEFDRDGNAIRVEDPWAVNR